MIRATTIFMMRGAVCSALFVSVLAAAEVPRQKPDWSTASHEARKQTIASLLAGKKFAEAAQKAAELNRQVPDDVDVYGYLAEAQIELGQFAAAEENVDWMFRLRPPRVDSLLLGARLRDQLGDVEGALDFCGQAFRQLNGPDDARFERVLLVTIAIEVRRDRLPLAEAHLKLLRPGPIREQAQALVSARRAATASPSHHQPTAQPNEETKP